MSNLSSILDKMSAESARRRGLEGFSLPAAVKRESSTSTSTSTSTSKPSSKKSLDLKTASETAVDESRAERVLKLELDFLMGRRTLPVSRGVLRSEWKLSATTETRTLLSLEDVAEGLVNSPALAGRMVPLLLACSCVGLDCEWSGSTLSTIQIATDSSSSRVFIFDVLVGGNEMLEALRPLLESTTVVKVTHDCRLDSRLLHLSSAHIRLQGVFDTQIAFALYTRQETGRTPLPCALNTALRVFAGGAENEYKEAARTLMEADASVWLRRPLPPALLAYAAADVRALPRAHRNILAALGNASLRLVAEFSREYAAQLTGLSADEVQARYTRGEGRTVPRYALTNTWDDEALSSLQRNVNRRR